VEIRIGVSHSMKELEIDLGDADRDSIIANINETLAKPESTLWLTDKKGRTIGVPSTKIAYVDLGQPSDDRKVGFAR
jgi:hypothetical protein